MAVIRRVDEEAVIGPALAIVDGLADKWSATKLYEGKPIWFVIDPPVVRLR